MPTISQFHSGHEWSTSRNKQCLILATIAHVTKQTLNTKFNIGSTCLDGIFSIFPLVPMDFFGKFAWTSTTNVSLTINVCQMYVRKTRLAKCQLRINTYTILNILCKSRSDLWEFLPRIITIFYMHLREQGYLLLRKMKSVT